MSRYPFQEIEKKWQAYWLKNKTFKVQEDPAYPKDKRAYVLDMFPYPSAAGLHVGHPEGYTATDIYCRYLRMKGFNVLHPMGFDSFGLPAENYAIKTGTHPKKTTEENIDRFREQIRSLGFSYDWGREISTHTPEYYRWTQWIFLKLWEKGLAYHAEIPVWYCPALGTVLANEEVLNTPEGPRSERGSHPVERRPLRQWILKITAYADRLLEGLDKLDWPESIKAMQRNWIGRSEGANVRFKLDGFDETLEIFTTRPDTLFGATYMVLAPEHPLVEKITGQAQKATIEAYLAKTRLKSDLERTDLAKEKTGAFTGAYAINPVNGRKVPIWISDYILMTYGTGAIMAVPAHDQRDWEFAKQFSLPIIQVVAPRANPTPGTVPGPDQEPALEACFAEEGFAVNSGKFDGLPTKEFKEKMTAWLESEGLGKRTVNYKLRDWIFSRQRYWGEPIPLIHAEDGEIVPVPYDELPLTLPEVESYAPSGTGESPLAKVPRWLNVTLPDGRKGVRETNTMPQWAGSCWYYLRFLDPQNTGEPVNSEALRYWMPVDLYVGGAEHAVLHLLYARFWHKVLYDIGVVNTEEPFSRLINQGMITSFAFQKKDGALVPSDEVSEPSPDDFILTATGEKVTRVIAKMSKSLKNVINPDDIIGEFGADSMRLYEMFMGPLRMSKPWSTQGLIGIHRFLDRVWRLTEKRLTDEAPSKETLVLLHKSIKKVGEDTANLDFNTAISQMMILVNEFYRFETISRSVFEPFVLLLAPYAPHLAEELWSWLGHAESLAKHPFPEYDPTLCTDDQATVVFQINGKLRSEKKIARGTPKEELEKLAFADERIKTLTEGKKVVKVICVIDKIVNIVVTDWSFSFGLPFTQPGSSGLFISSPRFAVRRSSLPPTRPDRRSPSKTGS